MSQFRAMRTVSHHQRTQPPALRASCHRVRVLATMTATTVPDTAVESHEKHGVLESHKPRLSVLPHRNTKVVHLIRHGESFHNVAGRIDHANYASWDYHDSHLTETGWHQAHTVREHIRQAGLKVDLVITSPLTRALETAVGVFGDASPTLGNVDGASNGESSTSNGHGSKQLLMKAQEAIPNKRAAHPAVSAEGVPPFLCHELCREHLGVHPCDRRLNMAEKLAHYPALDFSLIESDEDPLWTLEHRETKEEIMQRGLEFLEWLSLRPETNIAVVSHSSFLHFMLTNFGHEHSTTVQGELHRWFENCELRTVVLADTSAMPRPADRFAFRGFAAGVPEGPEV